MGYRRCTPRRVRALAAISTLESKGADVNARDKNGLTPLQRGCDRGHRGRGRAALLMPVPISNAMKRAMQRPLHYAVDQRRRTHARLVDRPRRARRSTDFPRLHGASNSQRRWEPACSRRCWPRVATALATGRGKYPLQIAFENHTSRRPRRSIGSQKKCGRRGRGEASCTSNAVDPRRRSRFVEKLLARRLRTCSCVLRRGGHR
jgi:hypothetical protein